MMRAEFIGNLVATSAKEVSTEMFSKPITMGLALERRRIIR